VWLRFSKYVISYTFNWLVQTVCIIWLCCLATVRRAYLCWFGLVFSSHLFFVARQQPDILRHSSHVFLGAVLVAVCTCSFVSWALWLFYGNECTDHKVSATMIITSLKCHFIGLNNNVIVRRGWLVFSHQQAARSRVCAARFSCLVDSSLFLGTGGSCSCCLIFELYFVMVTFNM